MNTPRDAAPETESRFDLTKAELAIWRAHGYSVKRLIQALVKAEAAT